MDAEHEEEGIDNCVVSLVLLCYDAIHHVGQPSLHIQVVLHLGLNLE